MAKREDFSKEARKSKPFTVRFPATFMKDVKEKRGLEKGQAIADFLVSMYDQVFNPIVGNPVFEKNVERERNATVVNKATRQYPFTAKDVVPQENVSRETSVEPFVGKLTPMPLPHPAAGKSVTVTLSKESHYIPPTPPTPILQPKANLERIKQLQNEIDNPPAKFTSDLAKKSYFHDRNKELKQLKG